MPTPIEITVREVVSRRAEARLATPDIRALAELVFAGKSAWVAANLGLMGVRAKSPSQWAKVRNGRRAAAKMPRRVMYRIDGDPTGDGRLAPGVALALSLPRHALNQ